MVNDNLPVPFRGPLNQQIQQFKGASSTLRLVRTGKTTWSYASSSIGWLRSMASQIGGWAVKQKWGKIGIVAAGVVGVGALFASLFSRLAERSASANNNAYGESVTSNAAQLATQMRQTQNDYLTDTLDALNQLRRVKRFDSKDQVQLIKACYSFAAFLSYIQDEEARVLAENLVASMPGTAIQGIVPSTLDMPETLLNSHLGLGPLDMATLDEAFIQVLRLRQVGIPLEDA